MESLENLCARFPTESHTAFHEAGHAVAASAFGWQVPAVHIVGNSSAGGLAWTWLFPTPDSDLICRQRLIFSAAGPIAAAFFDPHRDPGGGTGTGDFQQSLELARKLVGVLAGDPAALKEVELARTRAKKLILQHWNDVECVAHSLLHHHFVARTIRRFVGDLAALDEAPYYPITKAIQRETV